MKTLAFFYGDNCSNCEALKPQIKELSKTHKIFQYYLSDSPDAFSKYRVRWIPTVFEIQNGEEVEKTRQVWNIDLTKY